MAIQSETRAATRQALIDSFCTLYTIKPIEQITVQELTRKAGYNRCTFYEYYLDVFDLLKQVEDEIISHFREKIIVTIKSGNIAENFIASFTEMQNDMEAFAEVFLNDQNSAKFAGRLNTAMVPVFMEQFNISVFDKNSIYAIEFYLAGVISMVSRWLKNGRDLSVEELGGLIRSLLTKGILGIFTEA
ncbi:hypothetical protein SDC9_189395 [bioreactor metagenome]|uniref:HTH tetR-type domain-containing protein n=1 Tax=bioreactor metagenome TaxID=1076179 RepID=A0A645HSL7_9ZZZZ|nr:TetR/AcrR family transcriptional regulator [Petrimonas sp.]